MSVMANRAITKQARRAAWEAAVAAQEELARCTRANVEDLATFFRRGIALMPSMSGSPSASSCCESRPRGGAPSSARRHCRVVRHVAEGVSLAVLVGLGQDQPLEVEYVEAQDAGRVVDFQRRWDYPHGGGVDRGSDVVGKPREVGVGFTEERQVRHLNVPASGLGVGHRHGTTVRAPDVTAGSDAILTTPPGPTT